jgi:phage tail-like protein
VGLPVSQVSAGAHDLKVRLQLNGPGWGVASDAVDIEVPSVYLDSFVFDETSQLVLFNQFPQPGDFDVDAGILDLKFELAPTDGSSVSTADTVVKVDGATVYDGGSGGFQPGFSGTVVSSSFGSTIFTVSVLPFSFESEQDVVVEVDSESLGGQTLSTSYVFTIEDTEPAYIEDVCPISKTQVRVRFSEKVVSSSSLESNDALNPSNYTFTPVTFPAYAVTASSVEKVAPVEGLVDEDTVFIVTLNQETTKDAGYNLEVFNVEDEDGNAVEAPLSMYTFIAKWPETASNRDFALWSMIPQMNKNEDSTGDLYNFIACLQDSLDVALCSIDEWIKIIDPDNAPIRFVDQMLIDLGNPFECPLTDIEKRKLVKLLIPIYLQKGTCNGIVNVVRFLLNLEGIDCDEYNCTEEPDETTTCVWTLGESFLPDDASPDDGDTILGTSVPYLLYSFKIKSDTILTEDQRNKIKIIVDYMKPAHTHCLGIVDPSTPEDEIDHLELGLSQLGVNWTLH